MSTGRHNSFVLFPPPEHYTSIVFFGGESMQAAAALLSTLPCAWCLREQGQPMGEGSHGICQRHKYEQLAQLARFRARQQQQVLSLTM